MLFYQKRLLPLVLFIALAFLNACQSDDAPIDNEKPTFTFNQEDQENFYGVTTLSFDLKDNKAVSDIKIFIDNTLISDQAVTSSNQTAKIDWDSNLFTDGSHILKVIVSDESGNTFEQSFTIVIKNTLLNVTVGSNYIPNGNSAWMFISTNKGETLVVKELENGKTFAFPRIEGFKDNKMIVNIFKYYAKSTDREIVSYVDVDVKDMNLTNKISNAEPKKDLGVVNLTITDMPTGLNLDIAPSVYSSEDGYNPIKSTTYDVSVHVSKASTDLMLTFHDRKGNSVYKFFNAAKPGDNLTASYKEFAGMTDTKMLVEDFESCWHTDTGIKSDKSSYDYNTSFILQNYESTMYSCTPLADIFDTYESFTDKFTEDDGLDMYFTSGSKVHTVMKSLTSSVDSYDFTNGKLKMKLTGEECNSISLWYSLRKETPNGYKEDSWSVLMPFKNDIDYVLPTIPQEIVTVYYSDGAVIPDFTSINFSKTTLPNRTYNDYVSYNLNGVKFPTPNGEYESLYKLRPFKSTNGRKSSIEKLIYPGLDLLSPQMREIMRSRH